MRSVVFADVAQTAGYVFFNLCLFALTAWVGVNFSRRRRRGVRAIGWLIALILLGFLCLGAVVGALNRA